MARLEMHGSRWNRRPSGWIAEQEPVIVPRAKTPPTTELTSSRRGVSDVTTPGVPAEPKGGAGLCLPRERSTTVNAYSNENWIMVSGLAERALRTTEEPMSMSL